MQKQIQKVAMVVTPLLAVVMMFSFGSTASAQSIPDYSNYYIPDYSNTYIPDYSNTYIPDYSNTYIPDYSGWDNYSYDPYVNYGSTWGGGYDTYSGLDSYGYGGYGYDSGYSNYGSSYGGNYGGSNCPGGYGYYPCCDFSQYCPGYDTTTYVVVPGPVTVTQNNNQNTNVNVGSTNTTPTPVPAPTVTISANPSVVDQGGSTTLTWTSQNAVSCTASGSWTGSKNVSGSEVRGNIFATQNYIITCYNSAGASATAQTSVTVRAAQPVTVNLTANPTQVQNGGTTVLSWTSTGADFCTSSGDWFGSKSVSGSEVRSNLQGPRTYSYTITCFGQNGGQATDSATVTVQGVQNLPPSVDLTANPMVVDYGNQSVLSWTSQNASYCVASGDWTGTKAPSGSEVRSNITSTRTYTVTCYNESNQSATDSVTVTTRTQNLPISVDLSADQSVVTYGGSTILRWTSYNADSCSASGDWIGSKQTFGQQSTGPLYRTNVYTITCFNNQTGQSATDSVTVTTQTQNQNVTVDLTADQYLIPVNGSTMLRWTSSGADYCVASGDWYGTKSVYGQQSTGSLYRTSTFNVTCYGGNGQYATDQVTVQVQGQQGLTTTATTLPADPGTYSCTFYGSVSNSRLADTSVWFDYGSTTNLGNPTAHVALGQVNSSNFNRTISGLSANTRYYYRAVAQTETGISYGAILSCITGSVVTPPPTGTSSARIDKSVANITRPSSGATIEAFPGDQLRYTITVTNTGDRTLSNLEVRDELSNFVDYRSGGEYNRTNRTASWTISRLGVGESKTLTLDVTAGVCATESTIENVASVDNAQITARTSNRTVVHLNANGTGYGYSQTAGPLAVTLDTDHTSVNRGENVTLRVALRNQSASPMNDGTVRVTLPSNLEFRNADRQSQINGQVLTFTTGVLAPAGIDEIRVTVTVKNGAVVGERLPVSADASYRDQSGAAFNGHGELALIVADGNAASVIGSDGFFPNSLVGWLLILLLLIVIVLLLKRALKQEYDGKPANA